LGHFLISAPQERVIDIKHGFRLKTPKGHKGSRSYASGTYEERLSSYLNQNIAEGEVFVDVGAFVGFYSCLAANIVGNSGAVWAFEPEPVALALLNSNIQLNKYANVSVHQLAVGGSSGKIGFDTSVGANIGPAGGFVSASYEAGSLEVEITSLDDFFSSRSHVSVDWIKLDTDGHELQALDGMSELSKRSPNLKLILEVDPSHFSSKDHMTDLYKRLQNLGFKGGLVAEDGFKQISLTEPVMESQHNVNVVFFK
jgi:FkbM family methyltransferase